MRQPEGSVWIDPQAFESPERFAAVRDAFRELASSIRSRRLSSEPLRPQPGRPLSTTQEAR